MYISVSKSFISIFIADFFLVIYFCYGFNAVFYEKSLLFAYGVWPMECWCTSLWKQSDGGRAVEERIQKYGWVKKKGDFMPILELETNVLWLCPIYVH